MKRLVSQFAATTADEMQEIANLACFGKNSLARRSGASPCQWVYGRNPKIPNSILSEPDAVEAKQVIEDSERYRRIEEMRHKAMAEYLQYEHSEALRKAVLRKSRPWRGPVEVGARIAYFRQKSQLDGEGTAEGYRQGIVIGVDPTPSGSVWIRNNRGRVVQVAREQLRGVEGEELWTPSLADLRMLRHAEDDLTKKHSIGFDHRGPAPAEREDRVILDAHGDPQVPGQEVQPLPLPPLAPLALPPPQLAEQDQQPVPATPLRPSTPTPATPRTRKQKQLADLPAHSQHQKHQRTVEFAPLPASAPAQAAQEQAVPEQPVDVRSGWFLDPDGRPSVVTERAVTIHTDPHGHITKATGGGLKIRSNGLKACLQSMSVLMGSPLSGWSQLSARTRHQAEDHQSSLWMIHNAAPSEPPNNQIYLKNQGLRPTLPMKLVRLLKLNKSHKLKMFLFLRMQQKLWQPFAVNAVALIRNKINFSCSARVATHTPLSTILA